jgi:hypothetical protein
VPDTARSPGLIQIKRLGAGRYREQQAQSPGR